VLALAGGVTHRLLGLLGTSHRLEPVERSSSCSATHCSLGLLASMTMVYYRTNKQNLSHKVQGESCEHCDDHLDQKEYWETPTSPTRSTLVYNKAEICAGL
jgi:hypothetical protein